MMMPIHEVEEKYSEAIDGGVATDFYTDVNIHGYRIKSSADGIEPTDLVNAFAGKSKAEQKKAFDFQKGVNIATATIDT